ETRIHRATSERPFSEEILPLTPRDFHRTVQKYRAAFGFTGGFETAAFEHAQRSPFILRLLFQVATRSPTPYLGFNSRQFFEQYLELSIRRTAHPEVSLNVLIAIARAMFEADREWLVEQAVRDALHIGVNDVLPPDLFE